MWIFIACGETCSLVNVLNLFLCPWKHSIVTDNQLLYIFALLFVEIESSPVRCLVSEVKNTACGAEFTVWLSSVEGATILYGLWILLGFYFLGCSANFSSGFVVRKFRQITCWFADCLLVSSTAGLPQYGQLGHGTDNEVCCSVILIISYFSPMIFR